MLTSAGAACGVLVLMYIFRWCKVTNPVTAVQEKTRFSCHSATFTPAYCKSFLHRPPRHRHFAPVPPYFRPAADMQPHASLPPRRSMGKSVSLQPIRCGYDTFLTSQNSVPLLQASRRAARADVSAVFFENSYIVDIQAYTATQLSVRNKNGGKTWLAALQNSLSCSLTLTILACKEVKMRGQNSQSQSLTLTILQRKTV